MSICSLEVDAENGLIKSREAEEIAITDVKRVRKEFT
jgi:hypothetical protein